MTTSQEVTDPVELEHARTIMRRLEQGREIHARFDRIQRNRPMPGSDLHGDDAVTAWMNSSHVVSTALTMATDNIRAIDGLLLPGDHLVVPMYAHYPILRSVLEAGAEAKWILLPDDRKSRITNVLRARLNDSEQDLALAKLERETIQAMDGISDVAALAEQEKRSLSHYAEDLAKIREIAAAQGIPWPAIKGKKSNGLSWIHIIKAVCSVEASSEWVKVPGEYAAGIWKIMSGLSHPSTTRSVKHSSMERLSTGDDGVVEARLSASLRWTAEAMTVAWNTTHEALDLLERRQSRAV